MTSLQKAIVAAWKANNTLKNVAGPFLDVAADGTLFPYGTYTIIPGANASQNFNEASSQQNFRIRFTLWATQASSLGGFRTALHQTFDKVKLVMDVGQCMTGLRREDFERTVARDSNADGQGSRATQSVTSYEFKTINPD